MANDMANDIKERTWTITGHLGKERFYLTDGVGLRADFEVEDVEGRPLVSVEFSSLKKVPGGFVACDPYARAEAARLVAQVLDTVGDSIVTGEPLDIRADDVTLDGPIVEVSGCDAAIAVAAFFGDDLCNEVA